MLETLPQIDLTARVVDAVVDRVRRRRIAPTATYRLQFHAGFTFDDAAAIVPYLHALGVSHVYASPYMRARTGSLHGYDACDHNELNPALGGRDGFDRFVEALRRHGMGHVLDVVPNHMAASHENPWWRDVLENGPNSPYSGFFDIDWHPVKDELENKVLLPVLGAQYGDVLEVGQLRIEHADGGFQLRYFDHLLPLGPKTVVPLLQHRIEQLQAALGAASDSLAEYQSIITALEHLPAPTATSPKAVNERQREKEIIKRRLRDLEAREPIVADFVAANVEMFNGRAGEPETLDRLDKLLLVQSYRLCHWRAASDEINYRRFFDINDLAAICTEKPEVFHATHETVVRLAADGRLDGLRIDHVDGLLAPETYLWRLQWAYLAQVARLEFARLTERPIETVGLGLELAPGTDGCGAFDVAAGDGGSDAAAATSPQTIGPDVLSAVCARLGLRRPTDADVAAVFGAPPLGRPRPEPNGGCDAADDEASRQAQAGAAPLYVVVEKILGPDEPLPETWPVAGTTGYDFTGQLNGLFIRPDGLAEIEKQYRRFTGETRQFADVVRECKRFIVRFSMAGELQMLAHRANRISEQHRKTRDFTLNSLRYALREVLANFPVYRTYPGPGGVSERDQRFVQRAIASAKRRNRSLDPATFDFIRDLLLLRHPPGLSEQAIRAREEFAGRFQQVTSPVMAKGVEDTAFYTYFPLLSANEVGADPTAAVNSLPAFHQQNLHRRERQRRGLLATSTHDTKRSEDVRARLNVLSEVPRSWRRAVSRWSRLTRLARQEVDGSPAPSPEDEYLFYQTLVGIWPAKPVDDSELPAIVERVQAYMEKATHEAKQRTSWINPNAEYDQAVRQFVTWCLTPDRGNRFLPAFLGVRRKIGAAGLYNALSQVVLKMLSPGVPDLYQGQELWDFSLVDPDNRRPVDYARRREMLSELEAIWRRDEVERSLIVEELARRPQDERLKLLVTWRLLKLRARSAELLSDGVYVPLEARGRAAEHVVAFAWQGGAGLREAIIVVAPRWWATLCEAAGIDDVTEVTSRADEAWGDTTLDLSRFAGERFFDVFTGGAIDAAPSVAAARLLSSFPVAVSSNRREARS